MPHVSQDSEVTLERVDALAEVTRTGQLVDLTESSTANARGLYPIWRRLPYLTYRHHPANVAQLTASTPAAVPARPGSVSSEF